MEHCPTCGAVYRGDPVCSRCGTDLKPLLDIEEGARLCRERAMGALADGSLQAARQAAVRAWRLHRSGESAKDMALVSLSCRRYAEALAFWREHRGEA